jgi:hypothetical protein
VVRDPDDTESLREAANPNIHRGISARWRLAEAFRELLEELTPPTGDARPTPRDVALPHREHIRLLQLSPEVQRSSPRTRSGRARPRVLSLGDEEAQVPPLPSEPLPSSSPSRVEELVRNYSEHPAATATKPVPKAVPQRDGSSVAEVEEILSRAARDAVSIRLGEARKITIEFGRTDDPGAHRLEIIRLRARDRPELTY